MFTQNFTNVGLGKKTYDEGLRQYMLKVYNFMAVALAITGLAAMLTLSLEPVRDLMFTTQYGRYVGHTGFGMLVAFAPVGIAMYFFWGYGSMNLEKAQTLMWVYSILTGMSLSSLGFLYTGESIARTFFITSSLFAAMSIYGYSTKKDLTSMGSLLLMGVIGILIASLVNIFIASAAIHFAVSVVGVIVFTGMVAWDTQRIKHMYYSVGGGEMGQKMALMAAFNLYLNFINLFLYIIRFTGERKE